jgi:hypothetical protein
LARHRLLGDALGDIRVEYDSVRQATGGRGVFIPRFTEVATSVTAPVLSPLNLVLLSLDNSTRGVTGDFP